MTAGRAEMGDGRRQEEQLEVELYLVGIGGTGSVCLPQHFG